MTIFSSTKTLLWNMCDGRLVEECRVQEHRAERTFIRYSTTIIQEKTCDVIAITSIVAFRQSIIIFITIDGRDFLAQNTVRTGLRNLSRQQTKS